MKFTRNKIRGLVRVLSSIDFSFIKCCNSQYVYLQLFSMDEVKWNKFPRLADDASNSLKISVKISVFDPL